MKLHDLVETWLVETGRVCDGSADALVWMERYEADYLRAWQECPRGDWLVLIAAALGADAETVFDLACEVSYAAVDELPTAVDWPRKVIARAMERRRAPSRLSSLDRDVSDAILDCSASELNAVRSVASGDDGRLGADLRSLVDSSLGQDPANDLPGAVRRACEAVAGAHEGNEVLLARRERYMREQQALVLAHATSAAGACLVGASIATGFVRPTHEPRAAGHVPRALSPSGRFRRDTLLVEAHRALLHASCARARSEMTSLEVWQEGTFAYASGLVASWMISPNGDVAEGEKAATGERDLALERAFRCAFGDAQRDVAERLRAAIPFSSLAQSARARRPHTRLGARAVVRGALEQLRNSASTAIATLESVRESLDAPCPPSSRTLLPILTSLREQLTSSDGALVEAIDRSTALHAERIAARVARDERGAN